MADQVLNIAKGRITEYYNRVKSNDPAASTFVMVLLKTKASDALLEDYDDLAALLAGASVEADFTNYARKVLTDSDLAALPAPDDTNNRYDLDLPDIVYTAAGGASNNTLVTAVLCYDAAAGADATIIPMITFDFAVTTDGSDLTLKFDAAGFFRSS